MDRLVNNDSSKDKEVQDPRRKALLRLLKDPDEEVRKMAAQALERLDGMSNLPTLLKKYRTGDKATRLKAIYALGKLGTDECLPALIHALEDDDEDIRAASIRVLGELREPKTLPALILKLNDPSITIQTMAAEALGNFPNRNLAKHLIPLLKRENKYLVISALESLAKLNAQEAIDPITELTSHPDPDVRKTAAKVLGEIQA